MNVRLVIIKCARWRLRNDMTIGDLSNEEGVIVQIYRVCDTGAETGIDPLCQQIKAVFAALHTGKTLKLIGFSTGLQAEAPEQFKFCVGRKAAQIKQAGMQHHIMGQIFLKHTHGNAHRVARHLHNGVDHAAVVVSSLLCGEEKHTVCEAVQCGHIYRYPQTSRSVL